MRKIPSVFMRNHETDNLLRDEVTPGCEWVLRGEGTATRKWDGTAVLVRDGVLYKRYDAKGKRPPVGWEACEPAGDPKTGHWPGWLPVGDGPEDWLHRSVAIAGLADGTYELVGPRINGNPDKFATHQLERHGSCVIYNVGEIQSSAVIPPFPRTFTGLRSALEVLEIEGVVFHHPDGRLAKVKRRDFGYRWPPKSADEKGEVERKAVLEYIDAWMQKLNWQDKLRADATSARAILPQLRAEIEAGVHIDCFKAQRGQKERDE